MKKKNVFKKLKNKFQNYQILLKELILCLTYLTKLLRNPQRNPQGKRTFLTNKQRLIFSSLLKNSFKCFISINLILKFLKKKEEETKNDNKTNNLNQIINNKNNKNKKEAEKEVEIGMGIETELDFNFDINLNLEKGKEKEKEKTKRKE
eukprot:Anaeramoba_flamelloidesc34038_g1_i1.p1 GENE.c34038_g1_i1~~c34038_g1_i1.p1  ORF type:complete len:163 (+),score=58.54 c34038_g1_i1:44-490(+)